VPRHGTLRKRRGGARFGIRYNSGVRRKVVRVLTWPALLVLVPFSAGAAATSVLEDPSTAEAAARAQTHSFWDRTNATLFVGVAASRALDYSSTRHFRAHGNNEILLTNDVVDNKPLFATIEVAATLLSIGISAWLHQHGHHKLERWVSILHIGVTTFGAVRNYNLKPVR